MKNRKNKGISVVVAVSIMLAALVTVSATVQAFIIPELNKETAYTHTQQVFNNLNNLYSQKETTIPISYSGIPFFSPTSFVGQLSFNPSTQLEVTVNNAQKINNTETCITDNATLPISNLSKAILNFQQAKSIEVNATFINDNEEKVTFYLKPIEFSEPLTKRFQLDVTRDETSSYKYTVFENDSLEIDFFSSIYTATSTLQNATTLYYTTNSTDSSLFLTYDKTTPPTDLTYLTKGSIQYDPSNFPLSYLYTSWGLIALQGGTSSIPCSPQLGWNNNQLILNLYNITSTAGTISGTGSAKISFHEDSLTLLTSSFSILKLRFDSNQFNLTNSVTQLLGILDASAPEDVIITFQKGNNWSEITIEGEKTLDLFMHNVDANIT